jgi:CheY-like chemotaxis protein
MATILIADDSRFQVQLMSDHLMKKGHRIVTALDALQAWMVALRSAPDAIVLDVNMPAGSGVEVLKRLRTSTKTQQIPVLVVSGSLEAGIENTITELGAVAFLRKPVDLDELAGILARITGGISG